MEWLTLNWETKLAYSLHAVLLTSQKLETSFNVICNLFLQITNTGGFSELEFCRPPESDLSIEHFLCPC